MAAGQIVFDLSADDGELRATFKRVEKDADGLAGVAQKIQRNWVAATAALAAVEGARRFIASAIGAASDLNESISKVNVVFGQSAGAIRAWADDAASSMGLSEQAALESAGTFGNLFTAMGIAQTAASSLSMDVVQLAIDLGSFNNIGTDEALLKLRAGLVGEAEPLRTLGININAAAVENKALEMGLAATKAELDDSAKVMARWALITEQSTNAAGDFDRTSDGLANQQKILAAEIDDLTTKLGALAVGPMTDLVGLLIEGTEAADRFANALERVGNKSLFGQRVSDGIDRTADSVWILNDIAWAFEQAKYGADQARHGNFGNLGNNVDDLPADPILMPVDLRAMMTPPPVAPNVYDPGRTVAPSAGWSGDTMFERMAKLAEGTGRVGFEAEKAASSIAKLTEAESARAAIASRQGDELITAYLEGGAAQVAVVREAQQALDAEWATVAEGLTDVLGVQVPDQFRDMWEQILDAQRDGIDAAVEEEERLKRSRMDQGIANMIQMQQAALKWGGGLSQSDVDRLNNPDNFTPGSAAFGGSQNTGVTMHATLIMPSGVAQDLYVESQELARTSGR